MTAMTAWSYQKAPSRQGQAPLSLVSQAHTVPAGLLHEFHARGESVEAREVARAVATLRAEFTASPAMPDKVGIDFRRVVRCIDAEPLEDGVTHSCEAELETFVSEYGSVYLTTLVAGLSNSRAAVVLRLLGRVRGLDSKSRKVLLAYGLGSENVELRDAAAQAAELWDDPATVELLRNHHEDTHWLAEYIDQVAHGLAG